MKNLGWLAPSDRVSADTARQNIFAQHKQIRALLERARLVAEASLDGEKAVPDAVASMIGDVRTTIEVHLTFEEEVLVPILKDDLPVGPARADRLLDEHKQQRAVLAALHREAGANPDLPILAAKLAALTSWLLTDMGEEERSLLTSDVIRDDVVVVDQTTG